MKATPGAEAAQAAYKAQADRLQKRNAMNSAQNAVNKAQAMGKANLTGNGAPPPNERKRVASPTQPDQKSYQHKLAYSYSHQANKLAGQMEGGPGKVKPIAGVLGRVSLSGTKELNKKAGSARYGQRFARGMDNQGRKFHRYDNGKVVYNAGQPSTIHNRKLKGGGVESTFNV